MESPNDQELLAQYANQHSEAAFSELVARHVALVHSAAIRQVQEPQLAEDVTQAVFILLARKAKAMSRHEHLSGWLCRTAYFLSRDALRAKRRRLHREQTPLPMDSPAEIDWKQIAPLLDEVVAQLNEKDRSAIVLRFYEQKSLDQVGTVLGVDADAAQKRVSRALEKLRKSFIKRGVSSATALIAGAISANSIQATPAMLANTVTAAALAKGAAASASTLTTLTNAALKIMAWTKAKTAVACGLALFLAAGTTTTILVRQSRSPWNNEALWSVNSDNFARAPSVLILRPTHFPNSWGSVESGNQVIARNITTDSLLARAYHFSPHRMVLPPGAAGQHFDLMMTLPGPAAESLREEIKSRLGLVARPEVRDADVLLLEVRNSISLEAKASRGGPPRGYMTSDQSVSRLVITNEPFSGLVTELEDFFQKPTLDQTGLSGHYDLNLLWETRASRSKREASIRSQLNQIGLDLVPARQPIKMLVVEKIK